MSLELHRDERVLHVLLDRPEKGNALNLEMSESLRSVVRDPDNRDKIIVLQSRSPGMFVSGSDVMELRQRSLQDSMRRVNASLFQELEDHPCPTVAVVDGPALGGGCEIALACDIRVTSTRAVWGLPEVQLGIVPSAGGMFRLARLVGSGAARQMVLTGTRLQAAAAYGIGLAQILVDPEGLDDAVRSLLSTLSSASPLAQQLAKEAMSVGHDRRRAIDAMAQTLCIENNDTQSRLENFLSHSNGTQTREVPGPRPGPGSSSVP